MAAHSFPRQIINSEGVFNVSGLEHLVKEAHLKECEVSYNVVSIMGPQSSGKSTLLNHLFGTSFQEMDSDEGRSQTTKGIWMAKAAGIKPCTLVMDLEGSDGRERGEDDTAFERQSALFALAISNVVLVNMWCHDIGREKATNMPLLRTVFQVMSRLFIPRKTTLLFVIRDKTRSPLEKLESILRKDIQKIWDSVSNSRAHQGTALSDFFDAQVVALPNFKEHEERFDEEALVSSIFHIWESVSKSGAQQGTALSDFFDVQVVALPSFETNVEQFDEEMVSLRQRFSHSIAPGGIAWDRQGVVHASGFSINAQQIWRHIKENKDLDLPSLMVMVSTIRCEQIAEEKFCSFLQNKDWRRLEEAARSGPEPHFGRQLTYIVTDCLSGNINKVNVDFANIGHKNHLQAEYQEEALPFDEHVRISKKEQLEEKLLELVQPAFRSVVGHLRSRALGMFKQAFDKALRQGEGFSSSASSCFQKVIAHFDKECADATVVQAKWDVSKEKGELQHDMLAHVASLRAEKLSKLINALEAKLNDALAGPVEALLGNANDETWASIRDLLRRETGLTVSSFISAIHDFKIGERNKRDILDKLRSHAKGVVETKAREVARKVLILMKERFSRLFFPDNDSMNRILTGKQNYWTITLAARSASLKLLAVMAAVRLDYKADNIERTLSVALLDNRCATGAVGYNNSTLDSLVSENWEGVPPSRTLITPVQCSSLWRQFIQENKCVVSQSFSVQVTVDTSLCEEISNKRFLSFSKDEDWLKLKKAARKGPVPDFGTKITSMIHACLSRYEIETMNFDKVARMSNQMQLKEKLLHLVRPSFQYILGQMRCDTLYDFQEAFDKELQSGKCFSSAASNYTRHYMALFDKACVGALIEQTDWDASTDSEDLRRDMDAHVSSMQTRKVNELVKACEGKLNDALAGPVETLLDGANDETWSSIRKLLRRETDSAISDFNDALSDFKMDERTEKMLDNLRDHAKEVVEEKAREVAKRVSSLMKDRFSIIFFLDNNSMLRVWTGKEDVVAITQEARSSSLKLLSVMAAVRLDDVADNIEETLSAALLYDHRTNGSESRLGSLVSDTWDEIPTMRTLLTPAQCKALWKQFIQEIESLVPRDILSPA